MRYKFRREFFGGVAYDTKNKGYLFFDKLVSHIIQNFNILEQNDSEKRKLAVDHGCPTAEIDDLINELHSMQLTGDNIDIWDKTICLI